MVYEPRKKAEKVTPEVIRDKIVSKPKNFITTSTDIVEKLQGTFDVISISQPDENNVKIFTFNCLPEEAEQLLKGGESK